MENNSKETFKAIGKTIAELSEANHCLGLSVNNLACNNSLTENIKVDVGYIKWISHFISERAKCVLENICGRNGLNQWSEDELSEKLSYEVYVKKMATNNHIRNLAHAIHKAEEEGEDGVEWLKKNTNIEDVMAGKVKKPRKPEPSRIGKILREWRGDRFSLYAIAKECGCRAEGLQRIEEGKDVTTTNLMHYLNFIKAHEPESPVIVDIWAAL